MQATKSNSKDTDNNMFAGFPLFEVVYSPVAATEIK